MVQTVCVATYHTLASFPPICFLLLAFCLWGSIGIQLWTGGAIGLEQNNKPFLKLSLGDITHGSTVTFRGVA